MSLLVWLCGSSQSRRSLRPNQIQRRVWIRESSPGAECSSRPEDRGRGGNFSDVVSFAEVIDKALAIDTRNGLYYYGRGRVFLLSGDKEKAVEDLKQAAVLGNRVAQNYLQNTLHIEWQ